MKEKKGWLGISGFTLAIAGFYTFLWISFLSLPIFTIGLIFSWMQIRRAKTKLNVWGLILNIIGVLLSGLTLIVLFSNPELFVGVK